MRNDRPEQLPLARTEQLIIKEVDDEVLVYDLKTDQAHCLNKTAALVWQNCDGSKSIKDIARLLESDGRTNLDDQVVWLALDELDKFNLLLQAGDKPAGISRRQIMRTIGAAAIALPVIISIASPSPVEAASCNQPSNRDNQCPCGSNGQCSSNHCVGSKCCPTGSAC
ncbi:MAG TPA: PqqD family protein [Pyrinomonadaceae bacterium]|nr:PqqD family protein [Pyrinomonadaceae bacterium]